MAVYITDPDLEERLREERVASGADRFDEVWEGVLFMPPLANNEHQGIATQLGCICQMMIAWPGLGEVYVGVNVSDRVEDWQENYRIPDVAVFLKNNSAKNCGTHWCGGPDFACEILSPDDRSTDKIPFYARVSVRELLLINRDPWGLDLYELQKSNLVLTQSSTIAKPALVSSKVLPLRFGIIPGADRAQIEVSHPESGQRWLI